MIKELYLFRNIPKLHSRHKAGGTHSSKQILFKKKVDEKEYTLPIIIQKK
jgi:hypothetical protein